MVAVVYAKSLVRQPISISGINEPIGNVPMPLISQTTITRGATAYWQTNFYDENNVLRQPASATISVSYQDVNGNPLQTTVAMTVGSSGPPIIPWTAELDTRNMGPGPVNWSIYTPGAIPVSVEDGSFVLTANVANQVSF